jgi:hypothetical protein
MDIYNLKKEELLKTCQDYNIKNCKSKNKSQIINLINNYLKLNNNLNTPLLRLADNVRNEGLDKFYTKPEIVDKCLITLNKYIKINDYSTIIEPSAGNGNFLLKLKPMIKNNYNQCNDVSHTSLYPMPNIIGIDIQPEHESIIKQDYLTYYPSDTSNKILVVGNPPFGKVSSLAIKFFNHSAKFSDVIAFIIPRTFRKISVQNKLNSYFHLLYDEDIPIKPCSFEPSMSVKCCFQIWKKNTIKREYIELETEHKDWIFLKMGPKDLKGQPTPPTDADFAIRAYGGKCGEIKINDIDKLRPKSWHWIKSNINVNVLIQNFTSLNYDNCKNTARQNSIGMSELVELYKSKFN